MRLYDMNNKRKKSRALGSWQEWNGEQPSIPSQRGQQNFSVLHLNAFYTLAILLSVEQWN